MSFYPFIFWQMIYVGSNKIISFTALSDNGFPDPIFDNDPSNVTFNIGETATLPCHVVNLQTRYVSSCTLQRRKHDIFVLDSLEI